MKADRHKLATEFVSITKSTYQEAARHLEAAKGDLSTAVDLFFEGKLPLDSGPEIINDSPFVKPKARIVTFGEQNDSSHNDDDDEEDEEKFFAGGGGRGGSHTQITGPDHDIQSIMKKLEKSKKLIPGDEVAINKYDSSNNPIPNDDSVQVVDVEFYANGFFGNGKFFNIDEPHVKQYMLEMCRSEISHTLYKLLGFKTENPVVKIHNKITQVFDVPKHGIPFSGEGQMLGSPCPQFITHDTHSDQRISVDESVPVIEINFRSVDGRRYTVRVNPELHTAHDLYEHIRTETGVPSFTLMTSYPQKNLPDDQGILADCVPPRCIILQKVI